jgi:hypothetical protein
MVGGKINIILLYCIVLYCIVFYSILLYSLWLRPQLGYERGV